MWAKLDDGFVDHPKIDGLSDAAFRLHIAALCHAGRYLTDGFIAAGRERRLVDRFKTALVAELVAARLWDPTAGGWMIHDYTDWNPTAADVRRTRAARIAAGSKGGSKRSSPSQANAQAHAPPNAQANAEANTKHYPVPVPLVEGSAVPPTLVPASDEAPAHRIARLHWTNASPSPVLSGGFAALVELSSQFLDAGYSEGAVLDGLNQTSAYTTNAVTFALKKPATNGAQPQSSGVLDRAAKRMVE